MLKLFRILNQKRGKSHSNPPNRPPLLQPGSCLLTTCPLTCLVPTIAQVQVLEAGIEGPQICANVRNHMAALELSGGDCLLNMKTRGL